MNSLRSLSSFLLFLSIYLLAAALPMPCHRTILTFAMVYSPHVQILPLFSDFLISAASAREVASSVSNVPSSHFIQITIQIFLCVVRLSIRLPSRYCFFCSFQDIAVCNPALFAFRPEAFLTNEYCPTDYS